MSSSETHREIVHGGRHAGQDGQGGAKRKRVETPLVEPCALRGASERGQGDVRRLAQVVQTEPQSHLKDCIVLEPWLSELSDLSDTVGRMSDTVGLSDCRTVGPLSEKRRMPVGPCQALSDKFDRAGLWFLSDSVGQWRTV